MSYALGKYSQAICDRCGFRYSYLSLKEEWNNFKVCSECFEPKAPQLEPTQTGSDAEALFQPRTDVKEDKFYIHTVKNRYQRLHGKHRSFFCFPFI